MPASLTTELADEVSYLRQEIGEHPRLNRMRELVERIDQNQLNAIALMRRGELSTWRHRQTREVAR